MATTTPNYGWPVPTSTDYVKDGATAIEALGDAIDATVFGLGGGGLALISTTTFTTSSSVSLPTNSFTSTYDNYKIALNVSAASATPGYSVRFRAAGTDSTAASYSYYTRLSSSSSGADTNTFARSQTSGVLFPAGTGTDLQSYVIDVMSPKLSQFTSLFFNGVGTVGNHIYGANVFNNTTSFDSLSVFPSTGTFTGTISVYGMRK